MHIVLLVCQAEGVKPPGSPASDGYKKITEQRADGAGRPRTTWGSIMRSRSKYGVVVTNAAWHRGRSSLGAMDDASWRCIYLRSNWSRSPQHKRTGRLGARRARRPASHQLQEVPACRHAGDGAVARSGQPRRAAVSLARLALSMASTSSIY